MNFQYTTLANCSDATGVVIAVDVLRAFSTAAFAFSRGANKILPVGTLEEAYQIKARLPDSLALGEVDGKLIPGFDYGNSPTQIRKLDLTGKTLIQRTSAGTQGLVRSGKARHLLAASFCVASATVKYIRELAPEAVTFVVTGQIGDGFGDEDQACAEFLETLLRGASPDPEPFIQRVYQSKDGSLFQNPVQTYFPKTDLLYCTQIDAFDFAMPVFREDRQLVMRPKRI